MKLAIGTAQLGMKYGVSGNGNFSQVKTKKLLDYAVSKQLYTIDTSPGYGKAHSRIGKCNLKELKIITKLPKINFNHTSLKSQIRKRIINYMEALRCTKIYCLLLHNPSDLFSKNGDEIYQSLKLLKEEGLIEKFGVSTYDILELNSIIDNFKIDIVQHPVNIIDRRVIQSDLIKKVKKNSIEFHSRSIFLQGLLLSDINKLKNNFIPFKQDIQKVQEFALQSNQSIQEICFNFILNIKDITKVIIGIDDLVQLKELVEIERKAKIIDIPEFEITNKLIIDPRKW